MLGLANEVIEVAHPPGNWRGEISYNYRSQVLVDGQPLPEMRRHPTGSSNELMPENRQHVLLARGKATLG